MSHAPDILRAARRHMRAEGSTRRGPEDGTSRFLEVLVETFQKTILTACSSVDDLLRNYLIRVGPKELRKLVGSP